jgi:ABC-type multidrug transport system fused ATPase/permease subunit
MIFSTHRFGNLTRHADLILYVCLTSFCASHWIDNFDDRYMNDSVIIETGTHEELLRSEGSDYARLWRMQAEAFL